MVKWLVLATVEDRIPMLAECLRTAREHLEPQGWNLLAVAQGFTREQVIESFPWGTVMTAPEPVGMHTAKMQALRWIENGYPDAVDYAVCSVDDDMEFTERTLLDPAVRMARRPEVGLVSAGWVNHQSKLDGWATPDSFVRQAIVYTGGGLVFDRRTARILLGHLPAAANFRSDNVEWSLACYLAGLENWRYRGSVAIHRVCRTGGRKAWVEATDTRFSDPRWITLMPNRIGTSAGLTPAAHRHHLEHRHHHTTEAA